MYPYDENPDTTGDWVIRGLLMLLIVVSWWPLLSPQLPEAPAASYVAGAF